MEDRPVRYTLHVLGHLVTTLIPLHAACERERDGVVEMVFVLNEMTLLGMLGFTEQAPESEPAAEHDAVSLKALAEQQQHLSAVDLIDGGVSSINRMWNDLIGIPLEEMARQRTRAADPDGMIALDPAAQTLFFTGPALDGEGEPAATQPEPPERRLTGDQLALDPDLLRLRFSARGYRDIASIARALVLRIHGVSGLPITLGQVGSYEGLVDTTFDEMTPLRVILDELVASLGPWWWWCIDQPDPTQPARLHIVPRTVTNIEGWLAAGPLGGVAS